MVSIILPVFNGEAHLAETIASALNQTYVNLELIVVDDGSTDRSSTIVDELSWRDHRIKLLSQPNGGVAAARNFGIAHALGEFIAPLDADDVWDKTKIERQVQRMNESGPNTGLVYSWWVWVDRAGTVLDASPRWRVEGRALQMLLEVNFTGNASVPLFRRSCIDTVGPYDERLKEQGGEGCEDWDLAIRVAERFDIAVTPMVLVGYRRRSDGMSTQTAMMHRSQQLLLEGVKRRRPEVADPTYLRSNDQLALHLAGVAFWSGQYLRAFQLGFGTLRSGMGIDILRYLPRVFAHRLLSRVRRSHVSVLGGNFAEANFPTALIPYDLIYARRRRGSAPPDGPSS